MKTDPKTNALYQDSRFLVTPADIRTPSAFYPIADTVGRIRRDILFWALGYAALMGFGLILYSDLLYVHEIAVLGGSIALALLMGTSLSIIQLDARGFPARMFVARKSTVRAVFDAITRARAMAVSGGSGGIEPEDIGET